MVIQQELYPKHSKLLTETKKIKPVRLILPTPHPKQYELIYAFELNPGVRFVAGACGTKFGKTYGCTIRLVKEAWENKDSLNWWIAPSYAQSKMAYAMVKRILPKDTFVEYKADLRLTLMTPNGTERSTIEFKSGDNPDNLRGFAVNFFVMDEAARVPYDSFVSTLTTTTQTRGRGIIISTPKGRNWFYDCYQRGEKQLLAPGEADPFAEWLSIRMPTWTNPYVTSDSIEEMKRNLPEDIFQQEVAAEFLLESAGVFRNIRQCLKGVFEEPVPGRRYVMGVDLARLRDFSVITVMDADRKHVVYFDRFQDQSWDVQYQKIIAAAKKYNATCCIDSTGIGDPIVQTLQLAGIIIIPYQISTNTAKNILIDKLRINIENCKISFPPVIHLVRELETYECEILPSGTIRYGAPSGKHDDTVISLAMANYLASQEPWVYRYFNARGI